MMNLDVLELRNDRRLGLFTAGVSLGLSLLGLWWGGNSRYVMMVVGGVGFLVGMWALVDRRVKLRVDEIGIRYARWGGFYVLWAEIAAIETRSLRGVEQICVVPSDLSTVLERMPAPYRLASWITEKGWSSRFVISTAGLEGGTPHLLEILRRYHAVRTATP